MSNSRSQKGPCKDKNPMPIVMVKKVDTSKWKHYQTNTKSFKKANRPTSSELNFMPALEVGVIYYQTCSLV